MMKETEKLVLLSFLLPVVGASVALLLHLFLTRVAHSAGDKNSIAAYATRDNCGQDASQGASDEYRKHTHSGTEYNFRVQEISDWQGLSEYMVKHAEGY